jgi:hypothetical protein
MSDPMEKDIIEDFVDDDMRWGDITTLPAPDDTAVEMEVGDFIRGEPDWDARIKDEALSDDLRTKDELLTNGE